jgi:glyoxylase-like metal-dependent hydrolase (beta-lactamase superfamily II)
MRVRWDRPRFFLKEAVHEQTAREDDSKGSQPEPLKWEVFVTRGYLSPWLSGLQGSRDFFQAMASTLIYGKRDALLVDAFMTIEQANALADWVASRNKNLTTIYITHGHGDHWFGVGTMLERFPKRQSRGDAEYNRRDAAECVPRGPHSLGGGIPGSDSREIGDGLRSSRAM